MTTEISWDPYVFDSAEQFAEDLGTAMARAQKLGQTFSAESTKQLMIDFVTEGVTEYIQTSMGISG